jgi:tetratricopeptide (TPR) repeat protein
MQMEERFGGLRRETCIKGIADCTESIRRNHKAVKSFNNRATMYFKLAILDAVAGKDARPNFELVFADYEEVLRRDPKYATAYANRSAAYKDFGRWLAFRGEDPQPFFVKAIEDCTKAIQLAPGDVAAHYNRANAYKDLGEFVLTQRKDPREIFRKALADFTATLRRNPRHAQALGERGALNQRLGEVLEAVGESPLEVYRQGLDDCRRALQMNPKNWKAHGNMGVILQRSGRFEEAVAAYEKVLSILPDPSPLLKTYLARARSALAAPKWEREFARASKAHAWGDFPGARERYEIGLLEAEKDGTAGDANARSALATASFNLARLHAQASIGRKGPNQEPKAPPPGEAEEHRKQALLHLGKARDFGWTDLDRVRKEPDLDPLRTLPAYKALVQSWGEKK